MSCTSLGISLRGDRELLLTEGLLRYGNCGGNSAGRTPLPAKEFEAIGGVLVTGGAGGNIPAALSFSSKELGSTTAVEFDAGGGTGGYCGLAYCGCGDLTGSTGCGGGVGVCGVADARASNAASASDPPRREANVGCCAGG